MTTRETRQAVPLGSLTSDLRTVSALCRQRMRSRGRSIHSWLMWADDSGNVYFSDADGTHASAVMDRRPDQVICVYQGEGVTTADILDDLQDAAARSRKTLGEVVERYCGAVA